MKLHCKESRDGTQRVVVVIYQNVNLNKKGEWIGNPVTVERCVSDLILVDDALNDSMLNPKIKIQNIEVSSDNREKIQKEGEHKVVADEVQKLQVITDGDDVQKLQGTNGNDQNKENTTDGNSVQMIKT